MDIKDNKDLSIDLVTMVRENFEGYTKKQLEGAIKACHLQAMLGHSSRKDFKGMVHANLIANCPVTTEDRASGNGLCPKTKRFDTIGQVCDAYS